ncbi:MAG: hypothetical protein RLZZ70_46 [Candidatus Parcubacteria bacterium]|jgi:hypothetical protein
MIKQDLVMTLLVATNLEKKMKLFAILSMLIGLTTPALADSFTFKVEEEVKWTNKFTETQTWENQNETTFAFNGGAGTNGTAGADADLAFTAALSGQYAVGDGSSYTNTNGDQFGEAAFSAGAFVATGALAADFAIDDLSESTVSGLVTAGGAGTTGTGTTNIWSYDLTQTGSFDSMYKLKVSAQ